jgi:hypothetical protein
VTSDALSFFTIDRGTASTAVALIAPAERRFRLLAAAVAPRGADVEALLGDLVARTARSAPEVLPRTEDWPDWARLTALTGPPPRLVGAGASERVLVGLEGTAAVAGWEIAGRIVAGRTDALTAHELVFDPSVSVVALAASETPTAEERSAMPRLGALLGALLERRDEVTVLLCGAATGWGIEVPSARAVRLPAPGGSAAADSELRAALRELLAELLATAAGGEASPMPRGEEASFPEGRTGLRVAVATLAGLLERRIEAVEVGHAAGSRVLAAPDAVLGHVVSQEAALVPPRALRDERQIEGITRWCALRSDPFNLDDRIRNLALWPWRDATGEGPRLRLAALRAALGRLDALWRTTVPPDVVAEGADFLVCSGGTFAALPPAAAILAVADTMRRPGAVSLFHDHARILAPLGTLPDDADRRRLLADLLDDALVPLGATIIASDGRPGDRNPATLRVAGGAMRQELELVAGTLRLLDLPPGVAAKVEVELRAGALIGTRSRRLAHEVTGGLGGMLIDTRDIPLRLPDRAERRRALLETWERPVWSATDA